MERKKALALIWKYTHLDFKGKLNNGEKAVLILRNGGTVLSTLNGLTDAEIAAKLPYALKKEAAKAAA